MKRETNNEVWDADVCGRSELLLVHRLALRNISEMCHGILLCDEHYSFPGDLFNFVDMKLRFKNV